MVVEWLIEWLVAMVVAWSGWWWWWHRVVGGVVDGGSGLYAHRPPSKFLVKVLSSQSSPVHLALQREDIPGSGVMLNALNDA